MALILGCIDNAAGLGHWPKPAALSELREACLCGDASRETRSYRMPLYQSEAWLTHSPVPKWRTAKSSPVYKMPHPRPYQSAYFRFTKKFTNRVQRRFTKLPF